MKIYEYEHMETYFELNELLWWTVGMLIHADGKSQLSADNSNTYEKKKKKALVVSCVIIPLHHSFSVTERHWLGMFLDDCSFWELFLLLLNHYWEI